MRRGGHGGADLAPASIDPLGATPVTSGFVSMAAGPASLTWAPNGGRFTSLCVDGQELLLPPSTDPIVGGMYPMAPFAGRVRDGELRFEGRTWCLARNLGAHAIHGTVFTREWAPDGEWWVTALGPGWPFAGSAAQRFRLYADRLEMELEVRAAERMPVTLGWHPWFRGGRVRARPVDMYRRDSAGIPDGTRVAPGIGPWDDCFVLDGPPEVEVGARRLKLASDAKFWVIYDERADAVCVEPQSGPPDAANLGAATVLEPGERARVGFVIGW